MSDISFFKYGGMNRILNPFLIKEGDLKLCLNYNSDVFYAKKRRTGYSTFLNNPDGGNVYSLIPFDRADGSRMVLRISGTSIYKYAFTGNTWGSATRSNFGGTNDQKQTIVDTTVANARLNASTDKLGQGIKVSGSGNKTVPSLWILLQKALAPGNLTLKIETDTTGSPSGTPVTNATATITTATVSTTASWIRVDFTTAPVLVAGTQYHLTLAAASGDATNYYDWYGSVYDVYANGSAKYSTDSGTTYSALTGELDLGFVLNVQGGSRCGSAILNNKLLLGNGSNKTCYTSDGVNFTDIADAPPCKYWIQWKGRVFGIGSPLAPSRLYYCRSMDLTSWANDPASVDSGGYLDVSPDFGGGGIGLDVEGDRLIVHKEGCAYRVAPDEFGRPVNCMSIGVSTSSHWSIGKSQDFNIGYFFDKNGFYEHTGETPKLISSPIQDLVEGVTDSSMSDLFGHFFGYKYYCTMGASVTEDERLGGRTFTNPLFVYDVRLQECYLYTLGHVPTCFASWRDSSDVYNMYMGDTLGNTFKWDGTYADNTTAIDGEIETWDIDFGSPHLKKHYERAWFYANPGCQSNILVGFDDGDFSSIGDASKGEVQRVFGDEAQNKNNITLRILDSSSTVSSTFFGMVVRVVSETAPPTQRGRVM